MVWEINCETCGKYKKYTFSQNSKTKKKPRFCSHKCRGCTKKFQWSKLTEEEKKMHAERIYNQHVIVKDGCWSWSAAKDKNGYGRLPISNNAGKIPRKAHQVSWWINFGEIPDGKLVCHTCDNPVCSNPDHLYLGSHSTNMKDKMRKNRHKVLCGSSNGMSKLSEKDVLSIRNDARKGVEIAESYDVAPSVIANIKNRKTWKHI